MQNVDKGGVAPLHISQMAVPGWREAECAIPKRLEYRPPLHRLQQTLKVIVFGVEDAGSRIGDIEIHDAFRSHRFSDGSPKLAFFDFLTTGTTVNICVPHGRG